MPDLLPAVSYAWHLVPKYLWEECMDVEGEMTLTFLSSCLQLGMKCICSLKVVTREVWGLK